MFCSMLPLAVRLLRVSVLSRYSTVLHATRYQCQPFSNSAKYIHEKRNNRPSSIIQATLPPTPERKTRPAMSANVSLDSNTNSAK